MDGTRILNAIDGTFRHGKIGMTCYANDGAYFDNISVLSGRHIGTNGSMWVKPFLQKPSQSSMTVCWETTVPTTGKVLWGTSPCIFTDSISVSSARIHEATIIGLTTATRYYYGVRYGDSLLCGADYTFKTNPLPSARVRICIWGDNRTDPVAHNRICEAMLTKNPDMVINVGDVVSNGSVYDQYRTEFFNPASNLIRCTPFYVAIGNHEGENAWYYNYFSLPGDERYFAVDYGAAHFVFMNSNISYIPVISEQYTWVSDELASTASQSAPWLFVMLHHPPYSEGWDSPGYDGEPNVRDYLVPVWELNDVDFVFAGHTHDYERGAKAGVNYIITGGGGSALDHWLQDWEWISIYQAVYHYVLLDITSSYVIYRAYDWNNALIESTLFGTYLDVEQSVDTRPGKFQIESVSPNPFNASARISFSTDVVEHIEVLITDISGRQIAKICDGILPAGKHEAIWEVERYSYRGKKVPSGTYFAVIRAGDRKLSQKIELIR